MIAGPRGARWSAQETTYASSSLRRETRSMRHATNKPTAAQADLTAQATRAVLNLFFAGGRYAHAVWWLISTAAILSQGTSRAVAVMQAFYHPWLLAGCSCAGVRVVSTGVGDRPEDLQCAASFWHVRGRLLRAWVGACCRVRGLRVRLHFGRWATAREDLRVLPAFATRSACVSVCCGRARALVAGVRDLRACVGILLWEARARQATQRVADSLPRHKRQRLTQPSGCQELFTLLDLCVSSLRRGHANLLCIVPILTDDPRRVSNTLAAGPSSCCASIFHCFLARYNRG